MTSDKSFSRESWILMEAGNTIHPNIYARTVLICEMLWKLATNPASTYLSKVKNGHPGTVLMPTLLDLCIASLYVFIAYSEHIWSIYQRWLLILSWRRSLSYRNEFINLLCKSMDWFLYDRDLRHERANTPLHVDPKHSYFYQEMGVASNFLKRQTPLSIIQQ